MLQCGRYAAAIQAHEKAERRRQRAELRLEAQRGKRNAEKEKRIERAIAFWQGEALPQTAAEWDAALAGESARWNERIGTERSPCRLFVCLFV